VYLYNFVYFVGDVETEVQRETKQAVYVINIKMVP